MSKLLNSDKDTCWVCGERFRSANPPGTANLEQHHVVPRNAGGTDGPLVNLCDKHHTVAHKLATVLGKKDSVSRLLLGEAGLSQQRLLWLASVIRRAEAAVVDDENKIYGSAVRLNAKDLGMLAALQKSLGKSRTEVLQIGLHLLFQLTFKGRKS